MKRIVRSAVVAVSVVSALVVGVIAFAYVEYRRPLAPKAVESGHNAIWVKHAWVGDAHTEHDYREFARLLQQNRISDVYAHVGPLNGDGTIDPGMTVPVAFMPGSGRSRNTAVAHWICRRRQSARPFS
jgi:hypothetical protein